MPRRLGAIAAVAFGVGLSVLDGAIANIALPTISGELGISSADSIWIVNAYQLAIMVSLLTFSALGDRIGYRRIYIGGLMLFTVSSVACALAGSFSTLVLARVLQGFGAAAVTSVNTTL
ncbi:MAG TPA: MFS transporter, partial [Alistipes sp.]|nr:MFS transporter [Alistipes sp.]